MTKRMLSCKDPTTLLLKGIVVDQLSLIPTAYGLGMDHPEEELQRWFPGWNRDLPVSNKEGPSLGNFNPNAIIDDLLRHRCHQVPAFRRIKKFVNKMNSVTLRGYSFIMTTAGYKGFVLGEPRISDTLFKAYGSRFPLVLRREDENESRYSFVGCAVVEEFMDGEAAEMMNAGKLEEQTIYLV